MEDKFLYITFSSIEKTKLTKFIFGKILDFGYRLAVSEIQQLVRKSFIKVNGTKVKVDYTLQVNDIITIQKNVITANKIANLQVFQQQNKRKQSSINVGQVYSKQIKIIQENIIFEDDNIIAFNKPCGLAVQGGNKVNFSLDMAFPYISDNLQIVHRIDKDTSGVLIVAKNKEVAVDLHKQFKEQKVKKTYLCLVSPFNSASCGTISTYLNTDTNKTINGSKRISDNKQQKVTLSNEKEGKQAISFYKTLGVSDSIGFLEFCPSTGRKHQIRVQTSGVLKSPIVGDFKYNFKQTEVTKLLPKRMYLHAYNIIFSIALKNPKKEYNITALLDHDFQKALTVLGLKLN